MDEFANTLPLGIVATSGSHTAAWSLAVIFGAITAILLRGWFAAVREAARTDSNDPSREIRLNPTVAPAKESCSATEAFATVAHEIKSPVNGIVGLVSTMRIDDLDPESRHKISLLTTCASHLADLVDSLPTGTTAETAARPVRLRPFEVLELLESVRVIATASTAEKVSIRTTVASQVPPILVGDTLKIRQVLLNYTLNAIKHGNQDSIVIAAKRESPEQKDSATLFCVSDQGPGIEPGEQQIVFEKFQRGAVARDAAVSGVGLGLALCRKLAAQMEGSVWLSSETTAGACFYLRTNLATATKIEPRKVAGAVLQGKRVLVVDDEEHNRLALAGMLEQLGFCVDTAETAPEALEFIAQRAFDLICVDCVLATTDGASLARAIRQMDGPKAAVPILAVTGFNAPEKRQECIAAGMTGFIAKPVTGDKLRFALNVIWPESKPAADRRAAPKGDRFKSLRLIAAKKRLGFNEVLKSYLEDLEKQLQNLVEAVGLEDITRTKYCTHGLYGRCTFIEEYSLEKTFRQIEIAAVLGQWSTAQKTARDLSLRSADIKSRITFESQTVQSE